MDDQGSPVSASNITWQDPGRSQTVDSETIVEEQAIKETPYSETSEDKQSIEKTSDYATSEDKHSTKTSDTETSKEKQSIKNTPDSDTSEENESIKNISDSDTSEEKKSIKKSQDSDTNEEKPLGPGESHAVDPETSEDEQPKKGASEFQNIDLMFAKQSPSDFFKKKISIGRHNVLVLSLFSWMTPIMWHLYRQGLGSLLNLTWNDEDKSEPNVQTLERAWKEELRRHGRRHARLDRAIFKGFKRFFVVAITSFIISLVFSFVGSAIILRYLLASVGTPDTPMWKKMTLVFSLIFCQLFRTLTFALARCYNYWTGLRVREAATGLLFKKMLALRSLKDKNVGELVSMISNDGHRLFEMSCYGPNIIGGPPLFIAGSVYIIYLMGVCALLAILCFVLIFIGLKFLADGLEKHRAQSALRTGERVGLMTEILTGMKLIKMSAWESTFIDRVLKKRREEKSELEKAGLYQSAIANLVPMMVVMAPVLMFTTYVNIGEDLKNFEAFSVIAVLNAMSFSLGLMLYGISTASDARSACERYKEVLLMDEIKPFPECEEEGNVIEMEAAAFNWEEKELEEEPEDQVDSTGFWGATPRNADRPRSFSIRRLSQDETNEQQTQEDVKEEGPSAHLMNVTLTIKTGKLIGICGIKGSGKSAILSAVIGRMLKVCGEVRVSGSVAYTGQTPWVFCGTPKENILFGRPFRRKRYQAVVSACCLESDFKSFEAGDLQMIGDRGLTLSGGQKHRIALARAVYCDSDVYLLDDPLSALDINISRQIFNNCITTLLKDKTVLLVTHHMEYMPACDQVILVHEGRVKEKGHHSDLLNSSEGKLYTEMYNKYLVHFGAIKKHMELNQSPINHQKRQKGWITWGARGSITMARNADGRLSIFPPFESDEEEEDENDASTRGVAKRGSTYGDPEDKTSKPVRIRLGSVAADKHQAWNRVGTQEHGVVINSTRTVHRLSLAIPRASIPADLPERAAAGRGSTALSVQSSNSSHSQEVLIDEDDELFVMEVSWTAYADYINAMGGILVMVFLLFNFILTIGLQLSTMVYLVFWLETGDGAYIMSATICPYQLVPAADIETDMYWASSIKNSKTTKTTKENREDSRSVLRDKVDILSGSTPKQHTKIKDNPKLQLYSLIYCMFPFALVVALAFRSFVYVKIMLRAATNLHQQLLLKVLTCKMDFVDATPLGVLLNNFSSDMDEIDVRLPLDCELFLANVITIGFSLVLICLVFPLDLLVVTPLAVCLVTAAYIYGPIIQQLKFVDNITRSPYLSHVASSLEGLATIHCSGRSDNCFKKFCEMVDRNNIPFFLFYMAYRWLAVFLDLLINLVIAFTSCIVIFGFTNGGASQAGLALTFAIQITSYLQFTLSFAIETFSRFSSVQRIQDNIQDTPTEDLNKAYEDSEVPDNWPSKGGIYFNHFYMRYSVTLPAVLKYVSFNAQPSEKIGIVGATGSGKSSLGVALFRLCNPDAGAIYIDKVNIKTVTLTLLRSKMSILPQDPMLFAGTLRYNLDPMGVHTNDDELWKALEKCHMRKKVESLNGQLDMMVVEEGKNFSMGERQLLCLARTLLRRSKILVLDEATASIDSETEALVQETIRNYCRRVTVLSIAHRLHTIWECDKILVMEAGQVVEFGQPDVLLKNKKSKFRAMVDAAKRKPAGI